jgi:hypothetical protein
MGSSTLATVGAIVIMSGITHHSLMLVWSGRVLTGFGEALLVSMYVLIGRSFTGQWAEMAFAATVVLGQLGNVLVFPLLPVLSSLLSLPNVYLVCALYVLPTRLAVDGAYALSTH